MIVKVIQGLDAPRVFGNGFPKPNGKDREKCLRWVQSCRPKHFTIKKNVTKDNYMCSLHFVGGNGPTFEHPDPIKCGFQVRKIMITFDVTSFRTQPNFLHFVSGFTKLVEPIQT